MAARETVLQEHGQQTAHSSAVAEYKRLLAYQKLDDLNGIARRWSLELRSGTKASVVEQMAARFGEPNIQQAILAGLNELGHQVLVYIHLALAPEYGLSAESIVRGMLHQQQRRTQPTQSGEPSYAVLDNQTAQTSSSRRKIQEQIVALAQYGILLPFTQRNAVYYTLPELVRTRLPPRPSLVPAYSGETVSHNEHKTSFGPLIHKLFAVWNILSQGMPGVSGPLIRHSSPAREPIEDQWALLRGWNHEPSEISALTRHQYPGSRSSPFRLDRVSAPALNWAMTVPAPVPRLQEADCRHICQHVGSTDGEVEFYVALLESLGTLTSEPGQPIGVDKSRLQRFLRLSAEGKIRSLVQAWIDDETWSEMQLVLRQDRQPALRLRRSLGHHDYKAQDLYQEWRTGRAIVLRFLSLLPERQWLSIESLLKAIFDMHPRLLHTSSDPSIWWLESPRTGRQFGTAFEDWQQSYGQFVLSMLQGPLQWLGMVRLGYASLDDAETALPVAFQLTEVGTFALGRRLELITDRTADSQPDASCCSVSEDLVVSVVPDRASLELHNLLHKAGRLLEATPDTFVYQLTADGVAKWLEAAPGAESAYLRTEFSVEALIALLDEHCHASSTVWREKLRTWERNRGLLHIYENITLIELSDDYALQELFISTSLADSLVYQFSPRLVAIWSQDLDALVQDMEKHGYTPRIR